MSVTSAPRVATSELMDALVLLSNPVMFKERIKEYTATTKKINAAIKKYDDAVKIASTIERAEEFAQKRRAEMDAFVAQAAEKATAREAKLKAIEVSLTRREGAHTILVKEHDEANTAQRNELSTQARSLATRESVLERGKKQLAQDNHALKQAQETLSERRARLADAIKN